MKHRKSTISGKINILLIIWHPIGGIRTFLSYVYGRFNSEQYKLIILLPKTSELNATQEELAHTDAQFEVLPTKRSILSFMMRVDHILRTQQIDIVHSQGFTSGVLAALPARFRRIPHILTSHDVLRRDQFEGLQGQVKKLILSFLLSVPDMIQSVSNDAERNLLEFFPRLKKNVKKQCVIHNGVDPKRFLIEERANLKEKIGLPEEAFLIGFFGRFMPQKGFDILIDAVEILAGQEDISKFSVVAFGWGGFIREEQESIENKGLSKYFAFLPFESNVAEALRGMDVVAMPSRWEAYGLLAAEALIAGVPVIGTDCIGLQEVLHNTPGKIIPSENANALAHAILGEMCNPSKEKTTAFRKEAAERFDVHKQVKKLKDLIEIIVTG
ncbi:MAG: glycosyltransferase family 1 protein [Candidatus Electrothrix sp. AX5]|nr:glycosyltransferase family 1 protein [Candidatus Electrothrix sp. AX5]